MQRISPGSVYCSVFLEEAYNVLSPNGNTSNQPHVEYIMNDIIHSQPVLSRFSVLDVEHAIAKLKLDKSAGSDSMQGDHFKYAHYKVVSLWKPSLFPL